MIRLRLNQIILLVAYLSIQCCGLRKQDNGLLVIGSRTGFGMYTAEILKAEGLTCFDTISPLRSAFLSSRLRGYAGVILSSEINDPVLWDALERYVTAGGNLISVIPQHFAPSKLFGTLNEMNRRQRAYIYIDSSLAAGYGTGCHRIQIHSETAGCDCPDSDVIAWFGSRESKDRDDPAVTVRNAGKGTVTSFMYNLPANIVLTRQGNPEAAGEEKDGIPGLRAMDLFTDRWVDTGCSTINQADEQMHLLVGILEKTAFSGIPLPRIWFFPDTLMCLVTLTNDGEFRGENDFETQFRDVDSLGARMSLYVLQKEKVTRNWARKWTERGFEISGHPDDTEFAGDPSWYNMDSSLLARKQEISELYGLEMKTVVNHWFVWCSKDQSGKPDFAAQAAIEADHGLKMDINYAHYDNNSSQGHFLGPLGAEQGNFTGSGLPMRFASSTGKIIDIFQHLNNVYDQQYTENHDPEGFFQCFRGLVDRSIDKDAWSYISIKSHNDEYYFSKEPLLKMISYANNRGVPVWTASHLADFLEERDRVELSGLSYNNDKLTFTCVTPGNEEIHPSILIPFYFGNKEINRITMNGITGKFAKRILRGKEYAMLILNNNGINKIGVFYSNKGKILSKQN